MLFSLARTRGEQPVVLSFMSRRRSKAELLTGEWYSRISRTHLRALSMGAPHSNGFRMGFQPFRFRQRDHRWRDPGQSFAGEMLDRDDFHKILHSQPTAETGRPAGGQNVVWAGGIIARRLGRIVADED